MENKDFIIENGRLTRYTGNKTEVVIPADVNEISEYVFHYNKRITSISIGKDVIIEDGASLGCYGLADKDGFVIVNDVLYEYCGDASVVVIPENVKCISKYAFERNNRLKEIIVKEDVIIRDKAVMLCPGLEDENGLVIINNVLLDVGRNNHKRDFVVPENTTCIGEDAFRDARRYGKYNSIYIPSSLKAIRSSKYDPDGGIPAYEIVGKKGSYAEKFAKKTKKTFKSINGDYTVDYSKKNRSADEIESFVSYMFAQAYFDFRMKGYLIITTEEDIDLKTLRDELVKNAYRFSTRYMNEKYKYYPQEEYEYESTPEFWYNKCMLKNKSIHFELGSDMYNVYGHGIPDFRDYASLFFKWLNGFAKRKNFKYEGMIIDGQDFGCTVETCCTLDTNIDNNRFDIARRRINKAIKPVLECEDYSEYWDDIKDFMSNKWWK